MSTFAQIISSINAATGYNIPSGSGYYISSSQPVGSGSVNDIVNLINSLTGFDLPATSASLVSGTNIAQPIIIYDPVPASGTISTEGIYPGAVIKADHVLRIIRALNGQAANDIIISGSFFLPQVPDQDLLESVSGSIEGTNTVDGGSY